VPAKRSDGQKLIAFPLSQELLDLVDSSRGSENRSAWIRRAIADELRALGHTVPGEIVNAPDRVGKGGAPSHQSSKKKSKNLVDEGIRLVAEGCKQPNKEASTSGSGTPNKSVKVSIRRQGKDEVKPRSKISVKKSKEKKGDSGSASA